MTIVLQSLQILGLLGAYTTGALFCRTHVGERGSRSWTIAPNVPPATSLLALMVLVPSVAQVCFPGLLSVFQRDAHAFFQGQGWRLVTPLFFQDGGMAGTIFNLVSLMLVGSIAEKLWENWQVLGIFLSGGIAGEMAGMFWQPIGAGNSVGNFSLAASIAVACLTRRPRRTVQVGALLTLCAYIALLAFRDIHGAAAVAGCVVAFALSRLRTTRRFVAARQAARHGRAEKRGG